MDPDNRNLIALPAGYRLGEYRIERYLGSGGFGITYSAIDENLDQRVAIKEYLPKALAMRTAADRVTVATPEDEADFRWGLDRFLDEARTLARFAHPNIVGVKRFIEAHGTGYIVMEYVDGESLAALLKRKRTITEPEIREHVLPVADGLAEVHAANLLHRDIKPGNIVIRATGVPVLIDFGSARHETSAKSRSLTAVITPGYAPLEQYSSALGDQRPTTDIYALGAVLYRCVTGDVPPDATDRALEDRLTAVADAADGVYTSGLLTAIDAALRMRPDGRPRDIAAFLQLASAGDIRRERPEDAKGRTDRIRVKEFRRNMSRERPENARGRTGETASGAEVNSGPGRTGRNSGHSGQSSPATHGTSSRRRWADTDSVPVAAVVGTVGILAFVGIVETCALDGGERPANGSRATPTPVRAPEQPFIVRTDPPFAQVELMNATEPYVQGMTLAPGRYYVRVNLPGYEPKRVWVNHSAATREHHISLDPIRQAFTVEVTPRDARVRITNIASAYEPGMMLAAGSYTVEVSAPGFETVTEAVRHGFTPTVHRIELPLSLGQLPVNATTMGSLEPGDLELDTGELADSWILQVQAGQTLTVDMSSNDFDAMLMLLDLHDLELVAEDDDSGLGTNAQISVDITEPGEYMVVATTYDVGEIGAYELRVDVSSFTRGSHEDDVLRVQGTPTAINVYSASGFERWHYENSYVEISTSSRRVTEWSNLSGNLLVRGPGSNTTNPNVSPSAATPTAMQDDCANDNSNICSIDMNGTVTGRVDFAGDYDCFAVQLSAFLRYRIDVEGAATNAGTLSDPVLHGVYSAQGVLDPGSTDDDGGRRNNAREDFIVQNAGLYQICVGGFGSAQGSYTLRIGHN